MKQAITYIADMLRADQDDIQKIETHLSVLTGKTGVMDMLMQENEQRMSERLSDLGLTRQAQAKDVYNALIKKIESDDQHLVRALDNPRCNAAEDCRRVLEAAQRLVGAKQGLFLKTEKAEAFLRAEPPRKIMEYLKYDSVDAMLKQEDLYEVFSALRFIEGSEWLNTVFFKQYETLTPDDFEEREIRVHALDEKWAAAAERFVQKKWHNISHLKELGVVFVLPITLGIPGELLRMTSLILHYMHEVPFYSDMFRKISEAPELFSQRLVSLLRGDVIDRRIPQGDKTLWLVVQRYLAKDDPHDWRLFAPHISPEAYHWLRAEESLVDIGNALDGFGRDMQFWRDLDWIGGRYMDEVGNETMVSFDLVDTVMSLVKQKELIKYLYHQQEALWNKIFISYLGREFLERASKDYLLQGYFEI